MALAQLREIRGDLLCARVIAVQLGLADAHAARAHQLTELIANALAHVERLMLFVEGDRC